MANNNFIPEAALGADAALASIIPDQHDAELARESTRALAPMLEGVGDVRLRIQRGDRTAAELQIPAAALQLLGDVLAEMARGRAVSVVPLDTEITTQQAADMLNVSLPFLVGLLEKGDIPFRTAGVQRRILFRDFMDYKTRSDADRLAAMDELAREGQELRLGYE